MHNEDWQKLLNELAEKEDIYQLKKTLSKIPNIGEGDRETCWHSFFDKNDRKALKELLDKLVRSGKYSSLLFPAIITRERAPNFWLKGEKIGPELEEAEKALYLILSSACFENVLLNLDNIKEEGRKGWRQLLVTEAGSDLRKIKMDLKVKSRNIGPFYLSLLVICFWLYQLKLKGAKEEGLLQLLTDWGISDDTSLVVFEMGRKKKEVHYFSRLSSFILKWFKGFFESEEVTPPSLITFLDSLTRVTSKKTNEDLVSEAREKFVFYLLKYHEINGELLSKLVQLKVQDAMSSEKAYGVASASEFYAALG